MIPVPSGVRVWLATGVTDMRRGMNTLTLQVQEDLGRDPHAGDLYVFRGRRGDLVKILWHDGLGISFYAKVPEAFFDVTGGPLAENSEKESGSGACGPGETKLRLYLGATPEDPVQEMFSF